MIHFINDTALDIRGIQTFGLSSKNSDQIGRFGTGLKYAIAVILRGGGQIAIESEGQTYVFSTEEAEFRGTEYSKILMNGEPLSFTTDLGRDWLDWMAFRELFSNAKDEGGQTLRTDGPLTVPATTRITVDWKNFERIWFSMEEYFIPEDEEPLWENDNLAIYEGRSKFLFYQGICVYQFNEPTAFRYNFKKDVDLTEDRTIKYLYAALSVLARNLATCTEPRVTDQAVSIKNPIEGDLDYSYSTPSDNFIASITRVGENANPTASALLTLHEAKASTTTVYTTEQPGGATLHTALGTLRALGGDLSKVKFALPKTARTAKHWWTQEGVIFLNPSIYDEPALMVIAVIQSYNSRVGDVWMIKRLIKLTMKDQRKENS